MNRRTALCWLALTILPPCRYAAGQTFQFRFQQGSSVAPAADGSTVTIAGEGLGRATLATVTATYAGSPSAVVSQVLIVGSGEFALANGPALPQSFLPGQGLSLSVRYQPGTSARASAQLLVNYLEAGLAKSATLNLVGTVPDFAVSYSLETNGNVIPLSQGAPLTFPSTSINTTLSATVIITNRGSGGGLVNSVALSGASFQLRGLPAAPALLEAGREFRFTLAFSPRQSGSHSGTLTLGFLDSLLPVQITGSTASSDFGLSYFFQADGNVVSIGSGGRIVFPAARVSTTGTAVVAVTNRGTGAGYVTSISVTGAGFQLTGVTQLPALVDPAKELRFGVAYTPQALGAASGALRIVVDDRTVVIQLEGSGTGPTFGYAILYNGQLRSAAANATVSLPDTIVGETSSVEVQVWNGGNADGTISGISVTGSGFQLSNLPIIPLTLAPDARTSFNLSFSPTQPGAASGRLRIGSDSFELTAGGKGSKLVYLYTNDTSPIIIQDSNRSILYPPVQVGRTASVEFIVRNEGTDPAPLATIAIVEARSAFRLENLPPLPTTVRPGTEISFLVLFAPTATGDNSARLRINSDTFNLVGSGTPPPPLPAVEIRGPRNAQEPLQQLPIGLSLAAPYPLPLTGTLTLSVSPSSFVVDPAVQFATGGRTVAFTIPANTTEAQFSTGADVRFQTGTVAAQMSIVASLATVGGIDVTPDSPPALDLSVAPGPPKVLDVRVSVNTSTSFSIVVTGLSTTRSLTQLELEFTSSAKYQVPSGRFALNIESASSAWYRSTESQAYGSLFIISVPFSLQGQDSTAVVDDVLQSVSATLTNERGRSNNMSVSSHP